jgi:hypothetical protein
MNEQFRAARECSPSPSNPESSLSRKELARLVRDWIFENRRRDTAIDEVHVGKIERGEIRWPNADYRAAFRAVLGVRSESDLGFRSHHSGSATRLTLAPGEADEHSDWTTVQPPDLDDLEAIELIRRVEASDTSPATLDALEQGTDRLCRAYTSTEPMELLRPLRAYRGYVIRLLDGRATLAQRRELVVLGGWLSLLTAICDIDLQRYRTAAANLDAVRTMATESGHSLLTAWLLETKGWQALTQGDPTHAVRLCEAGLDLVVPDTSVFVQLSMNQARASARLADSKETLRLLDQAAAALDRMPPPEHPEHHFTFDPRKLVSYTATTLAWLDDDLPLAQDYARRAVDQYDTGTTDGRWTYRLALARVDLALVLARIGEPSEAAHLGTLALDSGLRPSSMWRAAELDHDLTHRYGRTGEIGDFHERFALQRGVERHAG